MASISVILFEVCVITESFSRNDTRNCYVINSVIDRYTKIKQNAKMGNLSLNDESSICRLICRDVKRRIHTIGVHSIRMVRCGVRSAE